MPESDDQPVYTRGIAFVVTVFSFGAILQGAIVLGFYYGFSDAFAADPDMPEPGRSRLVARAFLFHDAPSQVVLIAVCALIAFTGFTSMIVHISAMIFRTPTKRMAIRISAAGGIVGTMVFVGYFVWQAV